MKILLIRPPIRSNNLRFPAGPRFGAPLGLLYVAAAVHQAGYDVEFYDALAQHDPGNVQKDETGAWHVGASWEKIAQQVAESSPAVVGITNPFSDFADMALRTARAARQGAPGAIIVAGGPHATADPGYFLSPGGPIDCVVRGEGEEPFVQLCEALSTGAGTSGIAGTAFLENGSVRLNPQAPFIENLDNLSPPLWDLAPMERYFDLVKSGYPSRYTFEYDGSHREISLVTSRGCPFNCVFCGNHLHMGRRWRHHSVGYILGQMELLIGQYGVRHFHFEDDNLSFDLERFEALLDGITANKWNITWDTPNGIRSDRLTPPLLEKCKASGCTYLIIGIESGNQRVLDEVIKKKIRIPQVTATAAACRRIGLDLHGFYVVGFPGEQKSEIQETLHFALKLLRRYDVVPHVGLARPLPGTELYDTSAEQGYLTEEIAVDKNLSAGNEVFSRRMIKTPQFDPPMLQAMVAQFNRKVMTVLAVKSAVWVVRHPGAGVRALRQFFRWTGRGPAEALRRVFFGGMLFKNNYLRPIGRSGKTDGRGQATPKTQL